MTLFVFITPLCWLVLSEALADDCGWTLTQAQDALDVWQVTVGGFHFELEGENAVSYRELIRDWGSPANENDPAKKLCICALHTFIREVNAFPGVEAREKGLIDSVFEIARSEMLLGTEDFIEVLDQDHVFSIDHDHPIGSPNPIDEEILLLEGPVKDWENVNHDLYGNFPQGRRDCIAHYKEAVNVFLEGLGTEAGCAAFANQNFSDPDELANKSLRAMGLFCRASARKSRAYKELADRQFARDYDRDNPEAPVDAKNTSLLAGQAAYLEAVTIAAVMPEEGIGSLVNSRDFQLISGNILEMENVHSYVTRGSNPFGYKNHYVSFRFDPDIAQTHGHRNNYEQMNYYLTHDRNYVGVAETSINNACGGDSPYMRDRVRGIEKEYNGFQQMVQNETNQTEGVRAQKRLELAYILGYGNCHDGLDNDQDGPVDDCGDDLENLGEHWEPDQVSYFTNEGEIGQLVSEIKKAKLRIDRIDQEMETVDSMVKIKSELLVKLISINDNQIKERTGIIRKITWDKVKIIKDTGEEMAGYAEEEARARAEAAERKGLINGVTKVVTTVAAAVVTVYTGGVAAPCLVAVMQTWAHDKGGPESVVSGIGSYIDGCNDSELSSRLGGIQARRERAAALKNANLVIKEGEFQIRLSELDAQVYEKRTNAEFEADILTLLLQKELLTIDMLIAEEDVKQVTMQLSAALKRALRLLQDREEFEQRVAQTEELQKFFMDPSARVLEDQLIMKAAKDFRLAAEMVYLTGKAMEYEINDDFLRLDDVFKMRRIDELMGLQQNLWDEYYNTPDIWNDEPTPRTLSLRRDLLGLPLAGFDPEADSRFKVFLEQHITQQGDFYIKFDTYLTVGRYDDPWLPPLNFFGQPSVRYNDNFPQDHWNEKIETIRVNINGMQNVDQNGASTSLTHYGTSYIRSADAEIDEYGYIIRDDVKSWDLEARTTGSFVASVDGQLHYPEEYYYNDQLVARSVATSDWRLKIQGRGLANIEDLLTISDIEIIIMSRGYPIQPAW